MTEATHSLSTDWPACVPDDVAKLRALAAGLPQVALHETVFDASLDHVWGLVGDLVDGTHRFERAVRSARILSRRGDRVELDVTTPLGLHVQFDVILRRGYCVMQSRTGLVGMAAVEEAPGRTRFAHFEGMRGPLGALLRPYFSWNVRGDMKRIERLLRAEAGANGRKP